MHTRLRLAMGVFRQRAWMYCGRSAMGIRLAGLYAKATRKNLAVTTEDTEIVIEGFPRSGNTYAYAAFCLAQARPVDVAHHVHGTAQVSLALRFGVPVMVLVREPRDAVTSLVVRDPCVDVEAALLQYLQFYQCMRAVRERVVVAPFDEVTNDFGAVIERVNTRFGSRFCLYEHTEENEALVREAIDRLDMADSRDARGNELRVARPTAAKAARREEILRAFDTANASALLRDASGVYREFLG